MIGRQFESLPSRPLDVTAEPQRLSLLNQTVFAGVAVAFSGFCIWWISRRFA